MNYLYIVLYIIYKSVYDFVNNVLFLVFPSILVLFINMFVFCTKTRHALKNVLKIVKNFYCEKNLYTWHKLYTWKKIYIHRGLGEYQFLVSNS